MCMPGMMDMPSNNTLREGFFILIRNENEKGVIVLVKIMSDMLDMYVRVVIGVLALRRLFHRTID